MKERYFVINSLYHGDVRLSISQALIHLDSCTEEQVSFYSEDSHTPRQLVDLSSPDRRNDSVYYTTHIYGQNRTLLSQLMPNFQIMAGGRYIVCGQLNRILIAMWAFIKSEKKSA